MGDGSRTWIVAAVVLAGIGLATGAVALLSAEAERLGSREPALRVKEGEACDQGTWAVVIRDGGRRICIDAAEVRKLAAREAPFAYECGVAAEPEVEPPAGELDPPAGPLVSAAIR